MPRPDAVATRSGPALTALVTVVLTVVLAGVLVGCADDDDADRAATSSASTPAPSGVRTLTPLPPLPSEPPSGRLLADMRQSSIDASLGQMQVWVDNDTLGELVPVRIVYRDRRLPEPVLADRLRAIPSDSQRGFPLALPGDVDCAGPAGRDPATSAGTGVVEVSARGVDGVRRVTVADETDVVGRYVEMHCHALALSEVADLAWSDTVATSGHGAGAVGTLELLVRPTGVPGRRLVVDAVIGTPLLTSAGTETGWEPRVTIRSDGRPTSIRLPLVPARCDPHAFAEGGGSTAFRVRFRLDGAAGEVVLRMGPGGRASAFAFARTSCGYD